MRYLILQGFLTDSIREIAGSRCISWFSVKFRFELAKVLRLVGGELLECMKTTCSAPKALPCQDFE